MNQHRKTVAQWIAREWGFEPDVMERIPEEDMLAYGKALLHCANGDGRITQQERDWIMGYLTAAGHTDAVLEQLRTYQGTERIEDIATGHEDRCEDEQCGHVAGHGFPLRTAHRH